MWPRSGESARLPLPVDETAGGSPKGGPRAGSPPPEGEPPHRRPPPPPPAARTPPSLAESPRWQSGFWGSRETRPEGDRGRQEGGHRLARGSPLPTSGDSPGWGAGAAAGGGARGSPVDPRPEEPGAMGAWGSQPLQAGDAPSAPAAPWDPQDRDQGPPHCPTISTQRPCSFEEELQERPCSFEEELQERPCSFEEELQGLRHSSDPLAQELARALETVGRFALHLFTEHQQLKSRLHSLETQHQDRVSHLLAENMRLQQVIQRLESSQEASRAQQMGPQRSAPQPSHFKGLQTPEKVFPMQIRTAGRTGGCERQFVHDVSKLLSGQGVSLKVEQFTETSRHLLLVFCPIASRFDTDIESAFEGLSGKQKVLLVVHKDHTGPFRDARQQGTHPAVVLTVHTRFTVLDGFYTCEMNEAAVADVAAAIKSLAEDP